MADHSSHPSQAHWPLAAVLGAVLLALSYCAYPGGALAQSDETDVPAQEPGAAQPQVSSGADPSLTRDEAQKQLKETKQQLESNKSREQDLSRDVATLDQERARLNQALIDAGQQVQTSEASLSETEQRLDDLNGQVGTIRKSISARKRTIVEMLSAMERIGRTPPPAFVTPRADALASVRGALLLSKVFPELKVQADKLTQQLDGLVAIETQIRSERDQQKQENDRLAAEQSKLDQLLAQKKQQLASSQNQLADVQQIAAQQAQQVTNLSDLIQRMDKEIAKAETAQYDAEIAAEESLRQSQQQAMLDSGDNEHLVEIKPDSAKVAFASPARLKPAMPFDEAKGSLPLPVKGKYLSRFGDADEVGGTRKGISIETRDDARVTAPADGWVVYAGPFRSYGQLLILNTGGGYHVLLAGMNRIDVSVGQFVLAGEPIAEMGGSGNAEGGAKGGEKSDGGARSRPALYVEFRKDGHPIDPDPWWADQSDKVQG